MSEILSQIDKIYLPGEGDNILIILSPHDAIEQTFPLRKVSNKQRIEQPEVSTCQRVKQHLKRSKTLSTTGSVNVAKYHMVKTVVAVMDAPKY